MGYADQFKKAEGEGSAKEISSQIYKFEREGQEIVGKLIGFEKFVPPESWGGASGDCMQYVIMTDEGQISVVLGQVADKTIYDSGVVNGDGLYIRYNGKKALPGGKNVNLFTIKRFALAE